MIGLWLENGELALHNGLDRPDVAAGEALVRVTRAGICNTDLELVRGYYPFNGILGHEFVGVVESAPAGHENLIDQRVVGEINAVCNACPACEQGRESHCANRTVLGIVGRHGAFAEYLTLPVGNLHVVPEGLPDEVAVFTEPLAAAVQITEQVAISASDRVLIVGDGKLGQLIARTLRLTGARLWAAGHHRDKLSLLADLGIDTVLTTAATHDGSVALRDFDVAIDCTGNPAGFDLARQALRPRGTLVMKSTYAGRLEVDASSLVVDEITLVGSRCGPFAPALELLDSGRVPVEDLIVDSYPLSAAVAAFDHARQPGALKILLHLP